MHRFAISNNNKELCMYMHVPYIGYISHALNFRILTMCPKIKTEKRI